MKGACMQYNRTINFPFKLVISVCKISIKISTSGKRMSRRPRRLVGAVSFLPAVLYTQPSALLSPASLP